ncbi:MAG TPA: DUF6335 family protein [Candidatus Xenobia bacterium]|jgi:hypothetical protein
MRVSKQQQLSEQVSDLRADSEAFTDDLDVAEAFDQEQRKQGLEQRERLLGEEQPEISLSEVAAGDVDADPTDADAVGEQAVGGQNPTPDQAIVEELGKSAGLTYHDAEPLGGASKLEKRDRNRWELDPASSEDFRDRQI